MCVEIKASEVRPGRETTTTVQNGFDSFLLRANLLKDTCMSFKSQKNVYFLILDKITVTWPLKKDVYVQ